MTVDKKYAIGVDVGGSHLCSAVIDLDDRKVCSESVKTDLDSKAGPEVILKGFETNLNSLMKAFGKSVCNIGFAFPGPFNYQKGISLINGVNKFDNIFGMNMIESLRPRLDVETPEMLEFRFINDASAFALGECFCGCASGGGRVMALTLGTGVGSGFVEDYVLDESSERVPDKGEVYCLPFEGTIADNCFSTRWVVKRYEELAGTRVSGAKDVADRYLSDPAAQQLFHEYGSRLGAFATPLIEKFNAGTLVLGGNISRAFPLFEKELENNLPDGLVIKTSSLLDSAAMIGAASLFNTI